MNKIERSSLLLSLIHPILPICVSVNGTTDHSDAQDRILGVFLDFWLYLTLEMEIIIIKLTFIHPVLLPGT